MMLRWLPLPRGSRCWCRSWRQWCRGRPAPPWRGRRWGWGNLRARPDAEMISDAVKILRHPKNIQPMYLLAGSRCGRCAGRAAAAEVADEAPAGLVEGGGHEGGVHGQRAQPHAHARHGPAAGLAAAWKCWTHFSTQAREEGEQALKLLKSKQGV